MAGRRVPRRVRVASPQPPPPAPIGPATADPAGEPAGLDAEVALLRRTIRQMAEQGKAEEARRQIETLCKVLRTRYTLDDRAADSLSQALARSLEEIGRAVEGDA